jgi:hypothetical protein
MGLIRPVWLVQPNTMPPDFGRLQQRVQCHAEFGFGHVPQQTGMYQQLHKAKDVSILLSQTPVKPTYLIVLAIGIVIPMLCPAQFIPHTNHGHTNGKQGKNKEVPDLLFTKCRYSGITCFSFHAAIPA